MADSVDLGSARYHETTVVEGGLVFVETAIRKMVSVEHPEQTLEVVLADLAWR